MDLNQILTKLMGKGEGELPSSAKQALQNMQKVIVDSDNPADVGVAISFGMAYVLATSKNPEKTLEHMMTAGWKVHLILDAAGINDIVRPEK